MTTQELTRKIGEIEPKVSAHEERLDNHDERLREVCDEQKEQRRLLVVIERIATGLDTVKEKVDDISRRVCHIEEKPGKRWESLVKTIIGILAAAVLGYALSKLGL